MEQAGDQRVPRIAAPFRVDAMLLKQTTIDLAPLPNIMFAQVDPVEAMDAEAPQAAAVAEEDAADQANDADAGEAMDFQDAAGAADAGTDLQAWVPHNAKLSGAEVEAEGDGGTVTTYEEQGGAEDAGDVTPGEDSYFQQEEEQAPCYEEQGEAGVEGEEAQEEEELYGEGDGEGEGGDGGQEEDQGILQEMMDGGEDLELGHEEDEEEPSKGKEGGGKAAGITVQVSGEGAAPSGPGSKGPGTPKARIALQQKEASPLCPYPTSKERGKQGRNDKSTSRPAKSSHGKRQRKREARVQQQGDIKAGKIVPREARTIQVSMTLQPVAPKQKDSTAKYLRTVSLPKGGVEDAILAVSAKSVNLTPQPPARFYSHSEADEETDDRRHATMNKGVLKPPACFYSHSEADEEADDCRHATMNKGVLKDFYMMRASSHFAPDPCVMDPAYLEGVRRVEQLLNPQGIKEIMSFHQ
eukprot:gene4301-14411_t